jgi:PAS domain S-box-containing protein
VTQGGDALTLQRLVDTLQSAETLEATVNAAVRMAPEILGVTQCWLFLVDAVEERLLPVAASGIDPDAMPAFYALGGAPRPEFVRRMIETRHPVIARADGAAPDVPADVAKRFDIRALLMVPLVSAGRLVGAMTVQTPGRVVDFTEERVALARTMALHVAGAIHTARLVRETEVRFKETAARLAVSDALGSTLDTTETMRRVAREIGRALGGDMVGAYLADADGAALRPIAGYHVPQEMIPTFLEFPLPIKGAPGHEDLWRARRAFWTADAADDRRLDPEMLRRFPHRSNLVVPMVVKGAPIGAFVVIWWRSARVVTPDELRLVESISDQAAMFLANARLYEALEERLTRERDTRLSLERSERRHAAFTEIVKAIAGELDLERLFALVGRRACDLFEADAAMIALIEGEEVVLRGHWGVPDLDAITTRRPIAETRVARVIRDRRPYATPDLTVDPVWRDSTYAKAGYRAGLEAPILLRDDVIGVIGVLQRAPRYYTPEDIRLLTAFAEHAALAVDRARLRAQRESRLRETERLLEVSQATASTLDVTEVARRTVREVVHALDADLGGAWMLEPGGRRLVPLAGYHIPPSLLEGAADYAVDPDHPLIQAARDLKAPLAFADSANDPRADHPLLRHLRHRSLLMCPMRVADEMVGGFAVVWLERPHVFTDDELRLVEGIARQAAVGIANARLIAAERQAGERLAASEARYRSLVENLNDIVYVHDLTGVIQEINEAGVRLSGYSREEIIGMRASDVLAPDDFARATGVIQRMAVGETLAALFTAEFIRKDGTRRLLECSGRVVYEDGVPVAVQGLARDITDRLRLEQRQAVLVALSRELASEVDLDALLGRIAARVRALMHTDAGLLLLVQGSELIVGGADGLEPELRGLHGLRAAERLGAAVVRERRPVFRRDLAADAPSEAPGFRAIAAVPLAVQDRILGVLEVLHHAPRDFSQEDLDFLEGLATQAALAIDNARLLAQTQARLRETETLLELGQTVIPALDLAERMRLLARGASRAFGADTVGAYLADSAGARLMPVAGYRVPLPVRDQLLRYALPIAGQPFLEEAWEWRAPVTLLDPANDPRISPELRARFPARAVVFAPIVAGERPIGALFLVWWQRERVLTPDELKLLGAICRHAALFIENARLYTEATGRAQEAQELARQARSLTENLDAAEVGRRTAESAHQMLGGIASTLRLLQPDNTLALVASSGDRSWVLSGPLLLDPPDGPVAQAALSRAPVSSTDILQASELPETFRSRLGDRGSLSLLAVPLQAKGALIGVLTIVDRAGRVFDEREVALLTAFADQAAVALENSRLYGDLRDALRRAEESHQRVVQGERLRALGELAGGVAHDFNNVLAIIVGRVEALIAEIDDPELLRHLEIVLKVASDAGTTVQRIQGFARKRLARPSQSVDLNEVVDEVVEVTRSRWKDAAQARGVRYEMVVEHGEIPRIAGEAAELREALTNIVFNALDAMPNGGTVSLSTAPDGDGVLCAVRDTGIGMPDAVRRRVFDPFFTTKGERGTGLGLSVVYGIVTRHGGDVDVESRLGRGATFTMRLPIGPHVPAPEPVAPPATLSRAGRVLIVEDEQEVREILTNVLRSDGHAVVACEDGDRALIELEGDGFDLVITDLGMPGLSGWDVARAVKELRPGTPVAMVTGWSEQIDPVQAGSEGIDYLIAKPFRRQEIRTMVASALGGPPLPRPP